MTDAYTYTTMIGASSKSWDDAVEKAVAEACGGGDVSGWVEVVETRGRVDGGKLVEWQVTVRVGHPR